MYQTLRVLRSDGALTLTLQRPQVYNAINQLMRRELLSVLQEAEKDSSLRVLVLTGEGKAFSSGQDVHELKENPTLSVRQLLEEGYNPIISALRQLPVPVVCRLNGIAAGAGCSLALACDWIVAAQEASLSQVFVGIGLVPDSGSSYFLPRLIGPLKAFELAATGRKVSAQEAFELGLINQVVPMDGLDQAVAAVVDYFAKAPTKAIGLIKTMLQRSLQHGLSETLAYEATCQELASQTNDYREGVQAFLEKRQPFFRGT